MAREGGEGQGRRFNLFSTIISELTLEEVNTEVRGRGRRTIRRR